MNALDIALLVIACVSTVAGLWRGFVKEALGLVSVVGSVVLAYLAAPHVVAALGTRGGVVTDVVAVVVLFFVMMLLFATLGSLVTRLLDATHLRGIDRFFGGVFGFARAAVLSAIGLAFVVLLIDPTDPLLRRSKVLVEAAPAVSWVGSHLPLERARTQFRERWAIVMGRRAERVIARHAETESLRSRA